MPGGPEAGPPGSARRPWRTVEWLVLPPGVGVLLLVTYLLCRSEPAWLAQQIAVLVAYAVALGALSTLLFVRIGRAEGS